MGAAIATIVVALVLAGATLAAFVPSLESPAVPLVAAGLALTNAVLVCVSIIRSMAARSRERDLKMNLETANIKLTNLDRMKSEFLSFASHQIKAPMSVVKGYASLIIDGSFGPVSTQVNDVAGKIKTSADRMIGLVNTLLDLRKLDEGRMTYEFAQMDLGPLVASVVDELRPIADQKGLHLTMEPVGHAWPVRADSQRLRQVVQNLVENAIKYTDKGSVTVRVAQGETPRSVRVTVSDTGRGISPDLLPKLFEQFTRDQSMAKEIAGTGLGLYIAKQMVEAHDGTIEAASPGPGKGSTFTLELPTVTAPRA